METEKVIYFHSRNQRYIDREIEKQALRQYVTHCVEGFKKAGFRGTADAIEKWFEMLEGGEP